ncbi:ADP-ribosylation family protein [Streptomyces sp. NPDC053048]|uniref:ADP-ribosylation family protein n=1 Tax=Streptomyces sp. NPDC053048 TaxID=3365694 RepID=UPI0037D6160D
MCGANAGSSGIPGSRAGIEERFLRDWGLELPESIFRFWTFLGSLGPADRRTLGETGVAPAGIMDLFADPGAQPRDGLDVRVHGRYYRDPPEFLTFLHGGSDGLHYGLWFDDGRTCHGVAAYRTNDGGGIDTSASTPMEAVRAILERCWRDVEDDPGDDEAPQRLSRLSALRDAVTAFETGDRPEVGLAYSRTYDFVVPPVDHERVTTLDGAGALVAGRTAHQGADEYALANHIHGLFDDAGALAACVEEARRRCATGDPAEALVLGRDLHWASAGDPKREALANELLVSAYHALSRPSLAAIADAHHRHRSLPRVDVLRSTF